MSGHWLEQMERTNERKKKTENRKEERRGLDIRCLKDVRLYNVCMYE